MKAASYMPETLLDPSIRGTTKTAFNRAYQTELSSFEWITAPENAAINRRFNMAMEGTAKMSQPGEVFEGDYHRCLLGLSRFSCKHRL